MSFADILALEEELGDALPASYRRVLLDHPSDLSTDVREWRLFDSTARVSSVTCFFQKMELVEDEDEYVVIGEDGGGN